jgi:hypothetical protein
MNYMVGLFGLIFNQQRITSITQRITSIAWKYFPVMWDIYKTHLKHNYTYKHPFIVPRREWDAPLEDVKKKKWKKEGKKKKSEQGER